jgi:hypothetical protein
VECYFIDHGDSEILNKSCLKYLDPAINKILPYQVRSSDVNVTCSWRGILDTYTTLCDKVYQWLTADQWFSLGTPVSSTNKTDRHDIAEILLNVALNTRTITPQNVTIWVKVSRGQLDTNHLTLLLEICIQFNFRFFTFSSGSNPAHGDVYSIQHHVIKFVSDL